MLANANAVSYTSLYLELDMQPQQHLTTGEYIDKRSEKQHSDICVCVCMESGRGRMSAVLLPVD